jgi:alcohol dehydrogenase class IV
MANGDRPGQHNLAALGRYPLTTDYGVPHGLANAMVMEAVMELYYPAIGSDLESLFSAVNTTRKGFLTWLNSFLPQNPASFGRLYS